MTFYNVLPFKKIPSIGDNEGAMIDIHERRILSYYQELNDIPLREEIIIDYLGHDIGSVLLEFVGRFVENNEIGMRFWMKGTNDTWKICRIIDIGQDDSVLIHFVGFKSETDKWIPADYKKRYEDIISMTEPEP